MVLKLLLAFFYDEIVVLLFVFMVVFFPFQGFECRGTVLSQRATAWENLLRATRRTGPLVTNPLEAVPFKTAKNQKEMARKKNKKSKKKK